MILLGKSSYRHCYRLLLLMIVVNVSFPVFARTIDVPTLLHDTDWLNLQRRFSDSFLIRPGNLARKNLINDNGNSVRSANVTALFDMPDTVCVNSSIQIVNKSTNATTYRWDFCNADINQVPTGVLLGNPGNSLGIPVFSDYAFDNGNYYAFVVNNFPGGLIRLNFGNSLLNTPIVTNLGNFSGSIPNSAQGLQVLKDKGTWYAFVVGGDPLIGIPSRIVKLDFGSSLNNTPVHTNWGNIGGMDYPVDLFIFQEENNWHGLTVNYRNSTITKFTFGTDFSGIPTGTNLGNIGALNLPSGICPINDNGNWRVFISNFGNNTLTRVDFGSSLLSTPTGNNLGNLGNSLNSPRDLFIMEYCDRQVGFLVNGGTGNLVRLDFSSLGTAPVAQSLGKIGGTSSPHSISRIFRDGSDLYAFLPNASSNTLSRIKFTGCTNSNIGSSSNETPPTLIYSQSGIFNVSLIVDEGMPTQNSICKQIVVGKPANLNLIRNYVVCENYDSIQLNVSNVKNIQWSPTTGLSSATSPITKAAPLQSILYGLTGTDKFSCSFTDSVRITINPSITVQVMSDSTICSGQSLRILQTSPAGLSYQWSPSIGLDDPTAAAPLATPFTTTNYIVTASSIYGCLDKDTISIFVQPAVNFSLVSNLTEICRGDSVQLMAKGSDQYLWLPSNLPDDSVKWFKPDSNTIYAVSLYRSDCNFVDTLSIPITVHALPKADIFLSDTLMCSGQSLKINSLFQPGANYQWTPANDLDDATINNPLIKPLSTGKYFMKAYSVPFCYSIDSIQINLKELPDFQLTPLNDTVCIGTTILLKSSGSQKSKWLNTSFALSINSNSMLLKPDSSQSYGIQMFDSTCQLTDTLFSQIVVAQKPVIQIEKSNDFTCKLDTVYLKASGGSYYYWLPANLVSDPRSDQPFVTSRGDRQLFEVTVYSDRGCSASKSIVLRDFSYGNQAFLVPNAFTPNNDGLNDCFGVAKWGNAVRNFKLEIFNRNGDLVFSTKDVFSCWDGTFRGIPQSAGTYIFMIEALTDCDTIKRSGTLVLLR